MAVTRGALSLSRRREDTPPASGETEKAPRPSHLASEQVRRIVERPRRCRRDLTTRHDGSGNVVRNDAVLRQPRPIREPQICRRERTLVVHRVKETVHWVRVHIVERVASGDPRRCIRRSVARGVEATNVAILRDSSRSHARNVVELTYKPANRPS